MNQLANLPRLVDDKLERLLASNTSIPRATLARHIDTPGALSRAVESNYLLTVELLLQHGAAPIYINLVAAIERGHVDMVRLLLEWMSPQVISDLLVQLLIRADQRIVDMLLQDNRLQPDLASLVLFSRQLEAGEYTGSESLDILIDRQVRSEGYEASYEAAWRDRSAQNAACVTLGYISNVTSRTEQVYNKYFYHLLTHTPSDDEVVSLLLSKLKLN